MIAGALASIWLIVTLGIVMAGYLMSVDEEWTGWGDVLLNPYLVVPYVAYSGLSVGGLWLLCRKPLGALI